LYTGPTVVGYTVATLRVLAFLLLAAAGGDVVMATLLSATSSLARIGFLPCIPIGERNAQN